MQTVESNQSNPDEINFREIIHQIKDTLIFLRKKSLIILIVTFLGGSTGVFYAIKKTTQYTAKLTFVLEEEKSGGLGLAGAMGLASSLGLDLGASGGGVFSGANLIEFMKSRLIIEKALLSPTKHNGKLITLADFYLSLALQKEENKVMPITFPVNVKREMLSFKQESLLGNLYTQIAGTGGIFKVYQADKKVSILTVETKFFNEKFAKEFTQVVVSEVSDFYIATKSKKAKQNYEILQRQTDSVRAELNGAITGVASSTENTFNLNSAMVLPRTSGLKRQVDVQANTAILTQLVTNLEMAKVALRKETPLIQIIDQPILPLPKQRLGKLNGLVVGGFLGGFIVVASLLFGRWVRKYLK